MLITILTATRNRAHLLKELAESITKQTYPHWEWLVVDNASADATQKLMNSLISEFPNKIKYFQLNQNLGFAEAIKQFLNQARGELFHFVGDDDILLPKMYELVVEEFIRDPELALVFTNYQMMMINNGKIISNHLQYPVDYQGVNHRIMTQVEFVKRTIGGRGAVASHSAVIRKSIYEAVGGWNSQYSIIHDVDLWFRVATQYKIYYLPVLLMITRKYDQSLIPPSRIEEGFEALTQYWGEVYEKTTDKLLKQALREYFFYLELRTITSYLKRSFDYKFLQRHARRLVRYTHFWKRPRFYVIPLFSFLPQRLFSWLLKLQEALFNFSVPHYQTGYKRNKMGNQSSGDNTDDPHNIPENNIEGQTNSQGH